MYAIVSSTKTKFYRIISCNLLCKCYVLDTGVLKSYIFGRLKVNVRLHPSVQRKTYKH